MSVPESAPSLAGAILSPPSGDDAQPPLPRSSVQEQLSSALDPGAQSELAASPTLHSETQRLSGDPEAATASQREVPGAIPPAVIPTAAIPPAVIPADPTPPALAPVAKTTPPSGAPAASDSTPSPSAPDPVSETGRVTGHPGAGGEAAGSGAPLSSDGAASAPADPAAPSLRAEGLGAEARSRRPRRSVWRVLTEARAVHLNGEVETGVEVEARRGVRMGRVAVLPALLYLSIWALVLLGVWVLVCWGGYAVLEQLGVLESVSRAVATALAQPLPPSGVLPFLEWDRVWPLMVLSGIALSVLWLITTMAFVLIHNAISGMMGGPRVRIGI